MYFNSIDFLVFFVLVYALYLVLGHRGQNRLLLVASYFFYGYWDWRLLSLLGVSTLVDFGCGWCIHATADPARRKRYLWLSMAVNLGLLGFFKYFGFFADSLGALLGTLGLEVHPWSLRVILPVGISFYTFQTMSYTIDIYRGRMEPTRNLVDFALFVAFFPQLVAGPIERARRLLPQVTRPRSLSVPQLHDGLFLVAWGLFKKVVLADNAGVIVDEAFAHPETVGAAGVALGIYAFALQIYGDFSGYSDIARGLAKLMGFELMVNFRLPYFAVRPSDFWSRWHISLSTWVRDYVYVPLSRRGGGHLRRDLYLVLTMTLIGLWHGAAWTFVLWGLFFGVVQVMHQRIRPWLKRTVHPATPGGRRTVKWVSMVLMFHTFWLSGFLFRAEDLGHTGRLLATFGTDWRLTTAATARTALALAFYWLPLWVVQVWQYRAGDLMAPARARRPVVYGAVATAAAWMFLVVLFGAEVKGGEEFIYFQF